MKFPKLTDLDKDQEQIYEGAPVDGSILIIGPPGTGKTVIAFHRAGYLQRLGQIPQILMYNKVLRQFTKSRDGVAQDVNVSTINSWSGKWWRSITGEPKLPVVGGDRWHTDWSGVQERIVSFALQGKQRARINWGHVIIDEGQDQPPEMYGALNSIMMTMKLCVPKSSLAITVLADDNQRLAEGRNSTVEEIRQALLLHADTRNVFTLKKNYRNTFEIARFAAKFYVGYASGIPELPERRRGALPTIFLSGRDTAGKNLDAFATRIAAYAKVRNEEIGVLVADNSIRTSMVNRLRHKLGDLVKVQSYAYNDQKDTAEGLVFDKDGHITVLNFMSAKGLEFDSVFIVDPGKLASGSIAPLHVKMTMYVLSSRARTSLNVMVVKDRALADFLEWLGPEENLYKLEEL